MTEKNQLLHCSVHDPVDAIIHALDEHGAVIVDAMLSSDVVQRMLSEVDPYIQAADPEMRHVSPVLQSFFGSRTRHVASLAAKSPTFATEVLTHPVFMAVCDHYLLPSCASYQLNLGHLIVLGPGAAAQPLHRDQGNWLTHMPRPFPELLVSSMTALGDFTVAKGATMVVPGSHRWGLDREANADEVAHAVMPAGSTVIYLGSTLHAAGSNTTSDDWRVGMHLSYTLGWLRTEENNYLGCPPTVARTYPRKTQEVLGYAIHDTLGHGGGYLGMVELQDPLERLASGDLP
jgi:ectoine hydroxylase-related dioxygenase (phytanoyl-CoA dioxygenase family)